MRFPDQPIRIVRLVTILSVLAAPVAAQTVALHADFNADTVGELPAADPPGDPPGDHLRILHQGGTMEVMAEVGAMTDQPLWMNRTQLGSFYIIAEVDPDMQQCGQYTVHWTSMVSAAVYFYNITVRGPNGAIFGGVEYRGAGAITFVSVPTSASYLPNTPQDFEMVIDMAAKTLDLSIDGVPVPEVQDWSFTTDTLISVNFSPGYTDFYAITVDDIEVIASECPTVSTEPTSWGMIKTTYD